MCGDSVLIHLLGSQVAEYPLRTEVFKRVGTDPCEWLSVATCGFGAGVVEEVLGGVKVLERADQPLAELLLTPTFWRCVGGNKDFSFLTLWIFGEKLPPRAIFLTEEVVGFAGPTCADTGCTSENKLKVAAGGRAIESEKSGVKAKLIEPWAE